MSNAFCQHEHEQKRNRAKGTASKKKFRFALLDLHASGFERGLVAFFLEGNFGEPVVFGNAGEADASTELITCNVVGIENLDLLVVLRLFNAVRPAYSELEEGSACLHVHLGLVFANDRRGGSIERFDLDYRFDLGSSHDSLLLRLALVLVLRTGHKKRGEHQDRDYKNSF